MKLFNLLFMYLSISCFLEIYFVWSDSSPDINNVPTDTDINIENPNEETAKLKINENLKEPASKTDDNVIKREEEAIQLDGFNAAQIKEMRAKQENFKFQAEVDRMMKLIINSLYTNKEIFLRELISNASDALDKIRFMSLTDPSVLDTEPNLSIKIKADKVNNLLKIRDTGIGMTRDDLIKQLGTIAKSGTSEFLSKIEKEKKSNTNDFIGQFGVGFYSVFLVSDSVTVISKHNDGDQYIWESDSSQSFTVTKDPRGNTLKRGTEIIIRLKSSATEYLEAENLRRLIKQYSQYLNFPIYLWGSQVVKENLKSEQNSSSTSKSDEKSEKIKTEGTTETKTEKATEEKTKTDETTETKKNPKANEIKWDWERINNQKPIWVRKPSEVTEEEYDNFYKVISRSNEKPLAKIHFNAEGEVSFRAILYIPQKAPESFLERDAKESTIKLYVRRVFITDKIVDIVPRYLSFIVGIIDSDDLPLNVSRETLQQEKLLKVIQKKLVRKILDMIKKLKPEVYSKFWKQFRTAVKIGLLEDDTNRNRLSKLYKTFGSKTGKNLTSFADYIGRMKTQQTEIFYICDESLEKAQSSPFIERFIKNGYEVLYFIESFDEHAMYSLDKYEGTSLLNLAQNDVYYDKTDGNKAKLRKEKENFQDFNDFMLNKVDIIKDKIQNIKVSDRLLSVPMVVTPTDRGWTGNMERLALSQSNDIDKHMLYSHLHMKKNLEINTRHPIIIEFNKAVRSNLHTESEKIKLGYTLFNSALLISGFALNDTKLYTTNVEDFYLNNVKLAGQFYEGKDTETEKEKEKEEEDVGTVDDENKENKDDRKDDNDSSGDNSAEKEDNEDKKDEKMKIKYDSSGKASISGKIDPKDFEKVSAEESAKNLEELRRRQEL